MATNPPSTFTLSAAPNTDVWRKPPATDVLTASHRLSALPLRDFHSYTATVSFSWTEQYDQGGLLLLLPAPKNSSVANKWVKAGIEFYNGKPCISVVAADAWADWGLVPLPTGDTGVTVRFERVFKGEAEHGETLRICVLLSGEWVIIREVTWAFWEVGEDEDVQIGCFAARPAKEQNIVDKEKHLRVHFSNVELA